MRVTRTNIQTLIFRWEKFLVWYERHRVLTLSALNALSLFVFASLAFVFWASKPEESHALGKDSAGDSPASEASGARTEDAAPTPTKPNTSPQDAKQAKKPARQLGARDYEVEVRRARRTFTQGTAPPSSGRKSTAELQDDGIERSDGGEAAEGSR